MPFGAAALSPPRPSGADQILTAARLIKNSKKEKGMKKVVYWLVAIAAGIFILTSTVNGIKSLKDKDDKTTTTDSSTAAVQVVENAL